MPTICPRQSPSACPSAPFLPAPTPLPLPALRGDQTGCHRSDLVTHHWAALTSTANRLARPRLPAPRRVGEGKGRARRVPTQPAARSPPAQPPSSQMPPSRATCHFQRQPNSSQSALSKRGWLTRNEAFIVHVLPALVHRVLRNTAKTLHRAFSFILDQGLRYIPGLLALFLSRTAGSTPASASPRLQG